MDVKEFEIFHEEVMKEVQKEWRDHTLLHRKQRYKNEIGIQSSQISALVAYLIKKGIITKEISDTLEEATEPDFEEMVPIPNRHCKVKEKDGFSCHAVLFRTTSGIVCDQGHGGALCNED